MDLRTLAAVMAGVAAVSLPAAAAAAEPPLALTDGGAVAGAAVVDGAGNPVGSLDRLVFDLDRGRVAYGLVSIGGRRLAVPWPALTPVGDHRYRLEAGPEQLAETPEAGGPDIATLADPAVGEALYAQFGLAPYWQPEPQTAQTPPPRRGGQP